MNTLCSITMLWFLSAAIAGQATDNMQAFPPAQEGMVRYVLQLPKQDDESAFKVELIVGKTVQVDKRNRYFFGGQIEEETPNPFCHAFIYSSEVLALRFSSRLPLPLTI